MPKKVLVGTVISTHNEKTIVVRVDTISKHQKYEKRFVGSKKYYAHDPSMKAIVNDTVIIEETKPISRTKRWILREIITKK